MDLPSPSPALPAAIAPQGATARLFLALWPNAETRGAASRWQAAQPWPPEARLHAPVNFHVTLPFIGALALAQVPVLAAACVVAFDPFDLVLDHVEVWPRGIVVLAPTVIPDALIDLQARLSAVVRAQGIALEPRDYRPHLTLARNGAGLTPVDAALPPVQWRVNRYVLAASAGGQYHVVQSYPAVAR